MIFIKPILLTSFGLTPNHKGVFYKTLSGVNILLCHVSLNITDKFIYRSMMKAKSTEVAKAAYSVFESVAREAESSVKDGHQSLIKNLVNLSLDHTKGTPQHKTMWLRHMINQKFPLTHFYDPYIEFTNHTKVKVVPNVCVDLRVLNEIPVLREYMNTFGNHLESITATGDSVVSSFPSQLQTNPDFLVRVNQHVTRPFDEKSGKNMWGHTTRGYGSVVMYDNSTNYNVQVTTEPFTSQLLHQYNVRRLNGISDGLIHDNVSSDYFSQALLRLTQQVKSINENDPCAVFDMNRNVQYDLWDIFQKDPLYPRAVSFVFTKHVDYPPLCDKMAAFRENFILRLEDRLYNMDRPQDLKDLCKAGILSYQKTVDPQVLDKILYLKMKRGVEFNVKFSDLLTYVMKQTNYFT